jgi:hypothetical protein
VKQILDHSKGITESERYLKRLCDGSFLSLWSFAGIFNNKGPGQELCDLLVLFEDTVIIFSDKNCAFPSTGDANLDWKRWYRKAIRESASQVYGAERWIRNFPDRVFLGPSATNPFPLEIPNWDSLKVHRIVVAHSITEHSRQFHGSKTGSLWIDSDCAGDELPFTIGTLDSGKGFVHVLDDSSLDIVLETLDTVPDFIEYLRKKERFFLEGPRILVPGEEELLGLYLKTTDTNNRHDFVFERDSKSYDSITVGDDFWESFSSHEQRKAQKLANRISYFWDDLIERFIKHFRDKTYYANTAANLADHEKLLRILARENRTKRRMLAEAFFELISKTPPDLKASRIIKPLEDDNGTYYVFLLVPEISGAPYEKYREVRQKMLEIHCEILKLEHPDAKDVVGLATESGRRSNVSEDLIYFDLRSWNSNDQRRAEENRKVLEDAKLLSPRHMFYRTVDEYPDVNYSQPTAYTGKTKGEHINKLCFCGSGRKFKKCHGGRA